MFPSVTGRSDPEFTADFQAWAEQQVAKWGYDKETSKKYDELKTQGRAPTKARQYDQAVPLWEQIAALRPVDALPHQRLAGLYLSKTVNQPLKAIEQLEALHKVELKDNRYAKKIARLYRDLKQYDKAADYALQAVYIDPYDATARPAGRTVREDEQWAGPGTGETGHPDPAAVDRKPKQANELHPREPMRRTDVRRVSGARRRLAPVDDSDRPRRASASEERERKRMKPDTLTPRGDPEARVGAARIHRPGARGWPKTFAWFIEEVGELANALNGEDRANLEGREFADVIASALYAGEHHRCGPRRRRHAQVSQ